MTRVARAYGPLLNLGKFALDSASAGDALSLIEASPIYQTIEIQLRIWGSRSNGTITDTIDQTETFVLTRDSTPGASIPDLRQQEIIREPGTPGSRLDGYGIKAKLGVSGSLAFADFAPPDPDMAAFILNWGEVEVDGAPPYPAFKRQRIQFTGFTVSSRAFVFSRSSGGTVTEYYDVEPPQWLSPTIPSGGRAESFEWGYSSAESIDTSAWSATQWRDYRGDYVFPAQSMITGFWTSGDMQRQVRVILTGDQALNFSNPNNSQYLTLV